MAPPVLASHEIRPMFMLLNVQAETQTLHNLIEYIHPGAVDRQQHPPTKRLECIQATNLDQQRYRGVAQRSELLSQLQMQISVLPVNRTPSSRSPPNGYHHKACIRQEVKEDPEEKVQATSAETVRRLGRVQTGNKNASKLLRFCSHVNGPALASENPNYF